MCLVAAHGLAAVVSRVEETSSAPSVASLLAYERVVEAIHARQAVIPLRYGCLMESESAIIRLLEDHRQEYEALLGRLRRHDGDGNPRPVAGPRPEFSPDLRSSPGAAYLASLRNRYGFRKQPRSGGGPTGRSDRRSLSGCYTEQRREILAVRPGPPGLAVLSDAENRRRTLSEQGPANLPSRRRETVAERSLAAV